MQNAKTQMRYTGLEQDVRGGRGMRHFSYSHFAFCILHF
jgi:hypothetical protein